MERGRFTPKLPASHPTFLTAFILMRCAAIDNGDDFAFCFGPPAASPNGCSSNSPYADADEDGFMEGRSGGWGYPEVEVAARMEGAVRSDEQ